MISTRIKLHPVTCNFMQPQCLGIQVRPGKANTERKITPLLLTHPYIAKICDKYK